jgi:tryptophan-rich sensory protein
MKKLKSYFIFIGISLLIGVLSALFTMGNMDIYSKINVPPLAPPSFLFPIVWTVLYILMGISAGIIFNSSVDFSKKKSALTTFFLSLVVNFFWSIIFFNLKNYLLAFAWILLLWLLILVTIIKYYKISKLASLLQIPYLLWVTFATYLTFGIYLLNK